MVDVRHRPGIAPMPTDGFFGGVVVFFERVSGSRTFACQYLLIHGFVTLCSRVKGSLGDGWQIFLLGLRDVLAVGSPFGFTRDRIVVRHKYLFDEVNNLSVHLSGTSPIGKVRKEANVATAIADFCLPIQMSPKPLGSGRNGCSTSCNLSLLVILILLTVNDAVAERCGCQIHLPRQIQQDFSLSRNARMHFRLDADDFAFLDQAIKPRPLNVTSLALFTHPPQPCLP